MAARMLVRCAVGSMIAIAVRGTRAEAQYLYAGPGTVVQSQVRGPFVYNLYGYPYLAPGSYLSAPVIVPPIPAPYLRGPVVMTPFPPGYGRSFYPLRAPMAQPSYRGYPLGPKPPRSGNINTPASPSPQAGDPSPRSASPRPSGTILQQKPAAQRQNAPLVKQPARTAITPEPVRPASAADPNAPGSLDPN
jgi:hypothetical protein